MKTRSAVATAAIVVGVCFAVVVLTAQDDTRQRPVEKLSLEAIMKDKLRFSHQLLTSLAREDFPVLQNSAQELRRLANQQWLEDPSPEYQARLKTFWTTLDGIESGAERKEIEEATLAYMQMTLACVQCHRTIRRQQRLQ